jgi:FdhE protein
VAASFFRKHRPASASPSAAVQAALHDLNQLASKRQSLATSIAVLGEFLPLLDKPADIVQSVSLDRDQVSEKLASGLPLLRGVALALPAQSLQGRVEQLCGVLVRLQKDDNAKRLAVAAAHGAFSVNDCLGQILTGLPDELAQKAASLEVEPTLAATMVRLTLFPYLSEVSAALEPMWAGVPWEKGYCPVCGSWPIMGELCGLEQNRILRCGLCRAAWNFPRLACPFCDNRDHHQLGYFHAEGEEGQYRAATCDQCHGYVKLVSTLAPLPGLRLLVADLATVHLDLAAADKGYLPPA